MTVFCPICWKEFAKPGGLACHMASKGDHVCCPHQGCTLVFKDKASMEKHHVWHQFTPPSTSIRESRYFQHPRTRPTWQPLQLFDPKEQQPNNRTAVMSSNSNLEAIKWSVIPESQYLEAATKLRAKIHSNDALQKQGYLRRSEANMDEFDFAPPVSSSQPKRCAVALDCEMVGCRDDQGKEHSVLARLSVVDYLTGKVIIDDLVQPEMQVTNWRTRWSGVTAAAMNAAVRNGKALAGITEAQAELWKYVDQDTVIVGQSLKNDFDALRIMHFRAVDSGIVAAEAIGIPSLSLVGLKITCKELLEIKIQQAGKRGHDSVEDSLAAREVVLFCLNEPEKVEKWAKVKRQEHAIAEAKRALKLAEQRRERMEAMDKKISWSREIWQEIPTKEELKAPKIRLPVYQTLPDWAERHRETLQKQYEMLIAPVEASWEFTNTQSREPWVELPPPHNSMHTARVPLSTQPTPEGIVERDSRKQRGLQDILVAGVVKQTGLTVITEEITTLLDDPLDDSEVSLLMEPILPASPSSVSTF